MSTYVLVHGSFHGAWCWEKVVPQLRARGHRAVAVDLPGHGVDQTPLAGGTLDSYVQKVARAIDAEHEPVVLVGHSMGGVVVTQAGEERADKIRALVYVCAFLPQDGQALIHLAKTDTESQLMPALAFEPPIHRVRPEGAVDALFHDCSPQDAARALERLIPEPLAIVETPVRTSAARWGRIPRTYLECTQDRALGPSLQRRMHAASPCRVVPLASSHSPFYSMPDQLAEALSAV